MIRSRSFVRALVVAGAILSFLALAALPALAQEPAASPTAEATTRPGPPASYYASYGLVALGGLTALAILAGYLIQAPGFRKSARGSE